jgi:hypothetical protein
VRSFDFSSWPGILTTLVGIALFALIGIGIRLLVMVRMQQRRERMNRQINERLKTLIAAYKILGGSFTGNLSVDPTHLRDLHRREPADLAAETPALPERTAPLAEPPGEAGSDRARRIRDAVEAALSDIILLGTEQQVRLAERAARDLVEGRCVETGELVVALRDFVRKALDLEPIPADLHIPRQGPTRPAAPGGRGRGETGRTGGRSGGGVGAGGGAGLGAGAVLRSDDGGQPAP